ncbi:MAG: site-specific integrase [Myxococcales bacterium]|nr:site-specific integrase [Myxococcales bacterium]
MPVTNTGEITKITIAHYKGTTNLEASVLMLSTDGKEIRRRWKSPHSSRTATERWARTKANAFLSSRVEEARAPALTFGEFAERFVRDHVRANRLAPSTAASMDMNLREHLLPMFGTLRLDQITDDEVKKIKLLELAIGTINKLLQLLGQILKAAIDAKHIGSMPKIKRVKNKGGRHPFYQPEDYERLVAAATATDPRALVLVLLGGDAGLRIGEIIALDWARVDFAAGKVHVEVADWRGHLGPPKGGKPRSVSMTPRLRAALQDLGESDPSRSARVLTRSEGRYGQEGDPVTRSVTREWLEATHTLAKVPIMGVHTLRHTFCSHLAMAGQPVTAIRDLAGHSSVAITNDYMHLAPAATVSAIDVLAAFHEKARATSISETGRRRDPAQPKK